MSVFARLGVTAAAMLIAAVLVAIAAAVVDLYLSGHGLGSISNEIISQPSWGIHLSMGDLVLLVVAAVAGAVTWGLSKKRKA